MPEALMRITDWRFYHIRCFLEKRASRKALTDNAINPRLSIVQMVSAGFITSSYSLWFSAAKTSSFEIRYGNRPCV